MLPIPIEVENVLLQQTTISASTQELNTFPTLEKELGSGAQGVVYKGRWRNAAVAVKCMVLDDKSKLLIEKEIEALSHLRHPNICSWIGWYTHVVSDSLPPMVALVTEYCAGGELFFKVVKEKMSEDATMSMFRQLFNAVFHIHSKNIIHCDIKLENIVLASNHTPKLIDFGLTNTCNAGTLYYAAPESLYMLHKGIDIWALGICMWACLTQSFPFEQAHAKCRRYAKVVATVTSKHSSICDTVHAINGKECLFSSEVKRLLDAMLCVDHEQRATIRNVQRFMNSTSADCTGKTGFNDLKTIFDEED